ncbi:MAG: type II toxin-antitoxin system RelE/ParE family toxin [Candidatus Gastranaerophilales bacterium]|nr:type II toxin-antitoxin system RelE/ParE family toxin [Candidatus Gastranaerophilales bacterium]
MIKSFKNKDLEKFYLDGNESAIENVDKKRLKLILAQIDAAEEIKDCKIPSFKFQRAKKAGFYSVSVGNGKRLVFRLTPAKSTVSSAKH